MPKKRVYELAKELGMESKVLIARLEKIGISVKSASASLEEADAERAKKELTAGELREVVEQRIKTTVIRRRTVVTAVEKPPEEVPLEEAKPPEKEPAEDKLKKAPPGKTEKVKKEKPGEEPAVPAETVSEKAVKEVVPPAAVGPAAAETKASLEQKAAPLEKSAEEKAVKPETKEAPVAPVKPTIITKHKIIRPETGKAVPPKCRLPNRRKKYHNRLRKSRRKRQISGRGLDRRREEDPDQENPGKEDRKAAQTA